MRNATLFKMFVALPALPFLVAFVLWNNPLWPLVVVAGVLLYYPIQQFGQAIGYHKLFAHRAFAPRAWYPYVSAFVGSAAFYGDPLSAAMIHRIHHRYADTDKDPHTPTHGRFHAYIGWMATYKPSARDAMCISDLIRDYPWMLKFRRFEWLLPYVFHGALLAASPEIGCAVLIACQLSIHNALAVNAFSHNPNLLGTDKSVDSVFLARWVNPIFLHKHHHIHAGLVDYSTQGVTDYWARLIRHVLEQPSTK